MDVHAGIVIASEVITGGLIIFGVVKSISKWLLKPINAHFKSINSAVDTINKIDKEFRTNGGGTMKDHLNRLTVQVSELQQGQRAQMAYETTPIFESDREGRCVYANRAYLRMLGVDYTEIEGQGWRNFISPDSREMVSAEWDAAVRDHRDFRMTYKFVHADGHEICASCEAFVIKNEKREVLKYVGAITEHESMEKCEKSGS